MDMDEWTRVNVIGKEMFKLYGMLLEVINEYELNHGEKNQDLKTVIDLLSFSRATLEKVLCNER